MGGEGQSSTGWCTLPSYRRARVSDAGPRHAESLDQSAGKHANPPYRLGIRSTQRQLQRLSAAFLVLCGQERFWSVLPRWKDATCSLCLLCLRRHTPEERSSIKDANPTRDRLFRRKIQTVRKSNRGANRVSGRLDGVFIRPDKRAGAPGRSPRDPMAELNRK